MATAPPLQFPVRRSPTQTDHLWTQFLLLLTMQLMVFSLVVAVPVRSLQVVWVKAG